MPNNSFSQNGFSHEGLFSLAPQGFAWATGIEDTFVPQTERIGERALDEYALTNHYLYWREDIDRAAGLGVNSMRYGIPWYRVEPAPGKFDWEWTDRVLEYAASKKIAIIADLMHYGTPLWLDNQFINASYPERVAAYCGEFANRYKHLLSHYTPLNESLVTVDFCGTRGIWPPYLRGDDGSAKILKAITRGISLSTIAIRQADPAAVIVHVDAAGEILPDTPALAEQAALQTARTFIATDLVCGGVDEEHLFFKWLLNNGFSENDLRWQTEHAAMPDVFGVNYYPEMSVNRLREQNGGFITERIWAGAEGLERAVKAFAGRYGRPVAITETSTNGTLEQRAAWLTDSLAAIPRLRQAGVPLVGYTWWPLFDLIDWVYRASARPLEEYFGRQHATRLDMEQISRMVKIMGWTRLENLELQDYLAFMGLYSLEMQFDGTFARRPTPLVELYTGAIERGAEFIGDVTDPVPNRL